MESSVKILAVIDWLVRGYAPRWLTAAGMNEPATYLSNRSEFGQLDDIEPGLDDLRAIANLAKETGGAMMSGSSVGLLCRDSSRAASSVAIWSSGWPQVVNIAWSIEFSKASYKVWYPVWNSTRIMARYGCWMAAATSITPIAGVSDMNGDKWAEAHEVARVSLLPVVSELRASAMDLVFHISE